MNNDIHVQGKVRKDGEAAIVKEMSDLEMGIADVSRSIESLVNLIDNQDWQQYVRHQIKPVIDMEQKTIDSLNKDISNNPAAMSQLIYHNAFRDALIKLSDAQKFKDHLSTSLETMRMRLKKLNEKYNKS